MFEVLFFVESWPVEFTRDRQYTSFVQKFSYEFPEVITEASSRTRGSCTCRFKRGLTSHSAQPWEQLYMFMGWIASSQNLSTEALAPERLRTQLYSETEPLNKSEAIRLDPNPTCVVLIKEKEIWACKELQGMCTHKGKTMRDRKKVAFWKPGKEA